jgi:GTP-binding protein
VYRICALSGEGTQQLCHDILEHLEACWDEERNNPEAAERELALQRQMQGEAREQIELLRRRRKKDDDGDDDDFDDDDYDVEVVYTP